MFCLKDQSHRLPNYEDLVYLLFINRMVSIPRKDGTLALHWAIRARHPAHIVRKLIPKDLSVWNAKVDRKFTALHEAVVPRTLAAAKSIPNPQVPDNDEL
jgi:ankyrin repeat protein